MDVEAVRTFLAVAGTGQFQRAGADLGVTQQAVSKRIAALERATGVPLLARTPRGAYLTPEGAAFLPHARDLVHAADRALAAVHPARRTLRIDVLNLRIAPAIAVHDFYRAHPGTNLTVVTPAASGSAELGIAAAVDAVRTGEIDATFRALPPPAAALPAGVVADRLLDDPLQLLAGPRHRFAGAAAVTPAQLRGHRLWIPGIRPGTEWAVFYDALTEAFDLRIDASGPNFGTEALQDTLAADPGVATLIGSGDRYTWPPAHDLRRIPLRDPAPLYPHALIRRAANAHPALTALRRHLAARRPIPAGPAWLPPWAATP